MALIACLLVVGCGGGRARDEAANTPARTAVPDTSGTNVARIAGQSPADVASAAVLAVYPDQARQPGGLVLTPQGDWRQTLVAAQFAADPLYGAVVPTAGAYLPPGPSDLVARLSPRGFPRAQGLQAVILGKPGDDVLAALQQRNLHLTELKAATPEQLTLASVPYRGGWAHSYSDEIVVVSSAAREFALPAAAWSAYSGDTVAFVGRDSVPDATRRLLVQRQKLRLQRPALYLIGPPSVISESVASQLSAYGSVKRVAGPTPAATAVALARYKDRKTGFGWGVRTGPANLSFANPRYWGDVFGALTLASTGPRAPLLLTDRRGSLPPEVGAYLDQLRNSQGNQAYVLGDERRIGRATFQALETKLRSGPRR